MIHETGRNKDAALAITAAIRERIRSLEDELEHWRKMLLQCDDAAAPGEQAPSTPAARRDRLAG